MTTTFYDVLGVDPDATTDEIRSAYRERLKESHPDLNEDDDANEATRRIIRARDVLTDEDERARYDRVGHEEFVGDSESAVDEDDVSNAAAAARRAGWASGESETAETEERGGYSRAEGRRRARDRRKRERAARERVRAERNGRTRETTGRARETTGRVHETTSGTRERATASTDGGAAAGSNSPGGVSASARSWNGSGGYSVRREYETGLQRSRLVPTRRSLTLLIVAFVLYPLMLFSALFPPFPLVVNLVVGLCTIFLVGYLQSRPAVGVLVFGAWSLITPMVFVGAGLPLTGLVGIVALTGTWLPFGLSVSTLVLVRP